MANYSNIKYFSTINGNGVRSCIFLSGCNLHCKGCFNQKAWDFKFGKEITEEVIDRLLESIEPEYIKGLSILGGEPLDLNNVEATSHIIDRFREKFGHTKNIWIWSGYYIKNMEEIQRNTALKCDYIVDGPFEQEKRDKNYHFRGSSNQNVWHSDGKEFTISEYND